MKPRILSALLLVALGWNLALAASALYAVHLPIVRSAPVASTCDPSAPLLDQDTGSLSAGLDPNGNYIIAYQDRAHGGQGVVARHEGSHLISLPAPALAQIAPQFSPPDSVKVGSVALVLDGPARRLYYTQRRPGDTTGPYGIWCLEF